MKRIRILLYHGNLNKGKIFIPVKRNNTDIEKKVYYKGEKKCEVCELQRTKTFVYIKKITVQIVQWIPRLFFVRSSIFSRAGLIFLRVFVLQKMMTKYKKVIRRDNHHSLFSIDYVLPFIGFTLKQIETKIMKKVRFEFSSIDDASQIRLNGRDVLKI